MNALRGSADLAELEKTSGFKQFEHENLVSLIFAMLGTEPKDSCTETASAPSYSHTLAEGSRVVSTQEASSSVLLT